MNTRRILNLLVLLLSSSTAMLGQSQGGGIDLQNMRGFGELFNISQREGENRFGMQFRSAGVDGTPWLFDETHKAQLILRSGDTLGQALPVNLNFEENLIAAILSKSEVGTIPVASISRVIFVEDIINDEYICLPDSYTKSDRDDTYRFYQVLHEGTLQFLKNVRRKLLRSNKAGAYSATDGLKDKYVEEVDYYLCETGQRCERIKLKGKHIIKTLEDWQVPTGNISKAERRARSEAELIELLSKIDPVD